MTTQLELKTKVETSKQSHLGPKLFVPAQQNDFQKISRISDGVCVVCWRCILQRKLSDCFPSYYYNSAISYVAVVDGKRWEMV